MRMPKPQTIYSLIFLLFLEILTLLATLCERPMNLLTQRVPLHLAQVVVYICCSAVKATLWWSVLCQGSKPEVSEKLFLRVLIFVFHNYNKKVELFLKTIFKYRGDKNMNLKSSNTYSFAKTFQSHHGSSAALRDRLPRSGAGWNAVRRQPAMRQPNLLLHISIHRPHEVPYRS